MSARLSVEALAKSFAYAAAALAAELSDHMRDTDPEAHAQLQEAIGAGHHIALALVTGVAGGACIQLDLVNCAGERCRVMSLNQSGDSWN